jgi:hypothetical protein
LTYYTNEECFKIKGQIDLGKETIVRTIIVTGRKGITSMEGFTLQVSPTSRTFKFKFDHPREKERWMDAMRPQSQVTSLMDPTPTWKSDNTRKTASRKGTADYIGSSTEPSNAPPTKKHDVASGKAAPTTKEVGSRHNHSESAQQYLESLVVPAPAVEGDTDNETEALAVGALKD